MSRRTRRWDTDPCSEMWDFLQQGHISDKNLLRIRLHLQNEDPQVRAMAGLLEKIVKVKPHKRRRIEVLAKRHWPIFVECVDVLGESFESTFQSFENFHASKWLWELAEKARFEIWHKNHGSHPCRCGSGATYADYCASRDDHEYAILTAKDALLAELDSPPEEADLPLHFLWGE